MTAEPRPAVPGPRRLLRRIRDLMASQDDAQSRLDLLTNIIAEETRSQVCSIYLVRPGGVLELSATHGLKPEAVHEVRLKPDEGLVGLVARSVRPFSVDNAPAHPSFSYKPETGEEPFKSFVGVPILRGGRLVGVLTAQTDQVRRMGEEEIETLQTVAMLLAEIVVSGDLVSSKPFRGMELRPSKPERFQGASLSPGIAIGRAVLFEPHVRPTRIVAEDAQAEETRLEGAIGRLRAQVDQLLDSARVPIGTPSREVLEAYRMFAHDRGWLAALSEAVRSGLTAEAAVERVRNEHRARLMRARDPLFRERLHDLEDLANRLLRHLQVNGDAGAKLPEDAILVARSVGPAELLDFDRGRLQALALEEGSATGHAAIVAKALGLPMVGRVEGALDRVEEGDVVIVDGEFGLFHVRPSEEVLAAYKERLDSLLQRRESYRRVRDDPAVTKDGVRVELMMNAGLLVELSQLEDSGAEGIGLFRTEFQFMVSDALPRLDKQVELYRAVLDHAGDKPVVFRTLDLGGDKVVSFTAPIREANPALGWRALRMGLDRPGLTQYQMRALIRASGGRPLNILLPMIADPGELVAARAILDKELAYADRFGHEAPSSVRVGLMMETPAAAFDPEPMLALADFVSVGANDLMQYFFAADRQNARVAHRYDVLSPGPLRLFRDIARACDAAGRPVNVCGEIAGRPLEACVLTALGYRRLSMAAGSVGPVKRALLGLDSGLLGAWLAERLDSRPRLEEAGGLRAALLQARKDAGLPDDAVDNS